MDSYTDEQLFSKLKDSVVNLDQELIEKAKNNDSDALHAIGSAYFEKGEYTIAKAWSLRSALKDNSNAQTALGLLYHDGLGHPVDFKQALYWYTKAASLGHRAAQHNIGVLFEEGKGIEINKQQALEWYTRSADQGLEEAREKVQEFHTQGVFLDVGQIMRLEMENKVLQLEKRYQSANDENKRLKRRLDSLEHMVADVEETKQLVEKTRKNTKKLRKKQTQFEQIVALAVTTL